MAQRPFGPTYLGTLAGLTLNLDDNVPNRYEFEIPMPKEKVNTMTWQDTYLQEDGINAIMRYVFPLT